jgi:hypothetical protein
MCENAKDKKYMNIANFPEKGKYNVQCPVPTPGNNFGALPGNNFGALPVKMTSTKHMCLS